MGACIIITNTMLPLLQVRWLTSWSKMATKLKQDG